MDLMYLAAFIQETKLNAIVSSFGHRDDLGGYPGLILILKPDPRALAEYVLRHNGVAWDGKKP